MSSPTVAAGRTVSFPLVWWRAFINWRILGMGFWLLLGWGALSSFSWSISEGGLFSSTWKADFLLSALPSWLGLWCCQAVQDLEHRRFTWLLPNLHQANQRGLAVAAVVAGVLGWLAHVAWGGTVPFLTGVAWGMFIFSMSLADLGWVGNLRERVMAWSPFLVVGAIVFRPHWAVVALTAAPVLMTLLSLALAALWSASHWPDEVRRRRVLLPVFYLSAMFGDDAAVRRRWFAGRGDPTGRHLVWPAVVDAPSRDRNVQQALHGFMRGGLASRVLLVATFVTGTLLAIAASNGWQRGQWAAAREWLGAALWGNPWGNPIHQWVDLLLYAYFAGTGSFMICVQYLNRPATLFNPLPLGRDSRRQLLWHHTNHHHAAYVLALAVVGGLPALLCASFGYATVGPAWPPVVLVLLGTWATLPLGQALFEGMRGGVVGDGRGGSNWGPKLLAFVVLVFGTMATTASLWWAGSTFGWPWALVPFAVLFGLARHLRRRILTDRLATVDLV